MAVIQFPGTQYTADKIDSALPNNPSDPFDPNNDWTDALQQALDDSTGETLYISQGTYRLYEKGSVTLPLQLPFSIIITGDAQFGAANVLLLGSSWEYDNNTQSITRSEYSEKYLFAFKESASFPRVEFHNLGFKSMNILDLRMSKNTIGDTQPAWAKIENCEFRNADIYIDHTQGPTFYPAKGIAINLLDHDFSVIEGNNFFNFDGLCSIRMMGLLQPNGSFLDNKATTQVVIRDNVFAKTEIGISGEILDSIKITGNDFAQAIDTCIDIGGNEYWQKIKDLTVQTHPDPDTNRRLHPTTIIASDHYYRNETDINGVVWDSVTYNFVVDSKKAGTGRFSNVNMRDNHFEVFKCGIAVSGSLFEDNNHATRIESNNFAQPLDDCIMIDLYLTNALTTSFNELNYGPNPISSNTRVGIRFEKTMNNKFILDNFYGVFSEPDPDNPLTTPNPDGYQAISPNYRPFIWKGYGGTSFRAFATSEIEGAVPIIEDDQTINGNQTLNGDLNQDGEFFAKLPANGALPAKTFSVLKKITKSKLGMNQNDTLDLIDPFSATTCGTLMLYVYNSIGTFCSTYALGSGGSITRISAESFTSGIYSLSVSNNKLIYTQLASHNNVDDPVDTYVTGVFTGIQ